MMHKACCGTKEVPYCFSRSSIKFEGHMDRKIDDLNPILSKFTKLVAAIKSLRFALFLKECFRDDENLVTISVLLCLSVKTLCFAMSRNRTGPTLGRGHVKV